MDAVADRPVTVNVAAVVALAIFAFDTVHVPKVPVLQLAVPPVLHVPDAVSTPLNPDPGVYLTFELSEYGGRSVTHRTLDGVVSVPCAGWLTIWKPRSQVSVGPGERDRDRGLVASADRLGGGDRRIVHGTYGDGRRARGGAVGAVSYGVCEAVDAA